MIHCKILDEQLSESDCFRLVRDIRAGGTLLFVGTVRNETKGRKVIRLEFEAYTKMAEKEMHTIATYLEEKWQALHVVIYHRVGVLEVEEIPVIIAIATPHRQEAFEACSYAINQLKKTVPIWKKEIFEDGEEWVSAHP